MSIFNFKRKALGYHAMGSSPSSGGSSTTTQALPDYAQPTAQNILSTSNQLSQTGVPQYTGQTYAGMNGTQSNAISGMTNLANSGGVGGQVSGAVAGTANNGGNNYGTVQGTNATAAQSQFANTTNPYANQELANANQQTTQAFNQSAMGLNSQFQSGGAFGGSQYQNAVNDANNSLGVALSNNASTIGNNAYNTAATAASNNASLATQASLANQTNATNVASLNSANYNTAQGRALTAAGLAPTLDANTLSQLNAAYTGGTAQQTDSQNSLNAQYQQWYQQAMAPYENLGVMENGLSAALGNGAQGVTSSTQSANPLGIAVGGATTGAGLLGSLAQSGYL